MDSPRPNSSWEGHRNVHLNDRNVSKPPVHAKRLCQVTMVMGNRTRKAISDAVYRIEP
jgi:hypothetical protein